MTEFNPDVSFKLPLSGNVTQSINPWKLWFDPVGSQFGLVNINLGESGNTALEAKMLKEVGSYGRQLGWIEDALLVLINHIDPNARLTQAESAAIEQAKTMMAKVNKVKADHAKT